MPLLIFWLVPPGCLLFLPTSQATEVLIFALACAGSTLLYGQLGLMSFGQGIFFGLGAYGAGLASIHWGTTPELSLLCGAILAAIAAFAIGLMIVSRKGVYFALLTVAFGQLFAFLNHSAAGLTGGENGLMGVMRHDRIFGIPVNLQSSSAFFVLTAIVFIAVMTLTYLFWVSRWGRALPAIRENEVRAQSLGYNTHQRKLIAFIISGAIAGIAGGLYAMFAMIVPPTAIELEMSERLMLMTLIGGKGSLHGAWLGSAFMIITSEVLGSFWPRYMIAVGIMLIGIVLFFPTGLFGLFQSLRRKLSGARHKDEGSHQ